MFPMPSMATEARRQHCNRIALRLRTLGYECDWLKVNRNYIIMRRYDQGYLALGYLVKEVGLKRKERK